MATRRTKLDRGQVLATLVEASGKNKEDIAAKAGYSRSSYYKHIENPDLDFHILIAYGKALNHDFREEFPDMPQYLVEDTDAYYGRTAETLEEALQQKEYWKNKYIDLMERYTALIEEKIAQLRSS
jgi:uncharacterized membrane protein YcgQ (UPF0703/DUF1980 family)